MNSCDNLFLFIFLCNFIKVAISSKVLGALVIYMCMPLYFNKYLVHFVLYEYLNCRICSSSIVVAVQQFSAGCIEKSRC